jgi:hypothetical protein
MKARNSKERTYIGLDSNCNHKLVVLQFKHIIVNRFTSKNLIVGIQMRRLGLHKVSFGSKDGSHWLLDTSKARE